MQGKQRELRGSCDGSACLPRPPHGPPPPSLSPSRPQRVDLPVVPILDQYTYVLYTDVSRVAKRCALCCPVRCCAAVHKHLSLRALPSVLSHRCACAVVHAGCGSRAVRDGATRHCRPTCTSAAPSTWTTSVRPCRRPHRDSHPKHRPRPRPAGVDRSVVQRHRTIGEHIQTSPASASTLNVSRTCAPWCAPLSGLPLPRSVSMSYEFYKMFPYNAGIILVRPHRAPWPPTQPAPRRPDTLPTLCDSQPSCAPLCDSQPSGLPLARTAA